MQPSNARGRKTRFALTPISWVIAAVTVYILLVGLAKLSGSNLGTLLHTDSLWPLSVIVPGLILGKVLGLMAVNLIAFCTPPLRRVFEEEEVQTGRHGFGKAMSNLAKVAVLFALITALGAAIFLRYR